MRSGWRWRVWGRWCFRCARRVRGNAIPNSVFYDDLDASRSQVRFTFCKKDDVLHEAATRLQRLAT